ncbi:hypothetical protein Trydic_g728 [Trypoxylus dichotomus]
MKQRMTSGHIMQESEFHQNIDKEKLSKSHDSKNQDAFNKQNGETKDANKDAERYYNERSHYFREVRDDTDVSLNPNNSSGSVTRHSLGAHRTRQRCKKKKSGWFLHEELQTRRKEAAAATAATTARIPDREDRRRNDSQCRRISATRLTTKKRNYVKKENLSERGIVQKRQYYKLR